jgi:hypothetical protein
MNTPQMKYRVEFIPKHYSVDTWEMAYEVADRDLAYEYYKDSIQEYFDYSWRICLVRCDPLEILEEYTPKIE